MKHTFRKLALTVAVAGTFGVTADFAQAVMLSQSGIGLVVPYVLYDSAAGVDTAIGVTTMGANTVPVASASCTPSTCGSLHWYFYNTRSCHEADSVIPMTSNDFVGFMWGDLAKVAVTGGCTQSPLNGMKGYLILQSESGGAINPNLSIFGDAAMIQGAWTSTAFIPVLPLNYNDMGIGDDGYPHVWWPVMAAQVALGSPGDDLDMRYYVAGLGKRTDLVIWSERNHKVGTDGDYLVSANVFNEDEVGSSNSVKVNDELTVITLTDTASPIGFVTSYKSGFITLDFPADSTYSPLSVYVPANTTTESLRSNFDSIMAFSMIYTPSGGAQTVLAHQR